MIVITGATGALNGTTTEHLLDRLDPTEIAVVARDVSKAERFAARGVEVRHGDYDQPDSLPAAFAGADQLLLVSPSDPHDDVTALLRRAVDAAAVAGVGRVLYTSHQGAAAASPFAPGRDHAAVETILADSGLAWTSLRNGFYLHSIDWLLGPWRDTGIVTVPADGPVSWTAREDAAEAAAVILCSRQPFEGPVTITASSAPTFEELAAVAADVTGRHIGFEIIDREDWIRRQIAAGTPEFNARFLLGMYDAAEGGFFAGTDPLLPALVGRAPRTVRDHLAGA